MGLIRNVDNEFTDWYRIQYNKKDKTFEVVRKQFKSTPERLPGTEDYQNRTTAFGELFKQLMKDFKEWD